ncbi:hypothetical protein MTO96_051447 [Rhipicephalus appendiculatus]
MKLITALLLLMETGFITCGRRNPYFIGKMEIVNNTCRYRGYGVPNSVCLDLSIPCVSVCCKATKAQLVLTGCPAPKSFSGTVRERDPFGLLAALIGLLHQLRPYLKNVPYLQKMYIFTWLRIDTGAGIKCQTTKRAVLPACAVKYNQGQVIGKTCSASQS